MLKFTRFDKHQRDALLSVFIIVSITVVASLSLPIQALLMVFPLQFVVTYFVFCKHDVKKARYLYIDHSSNKTWNTSLSQAFPSVNAILMFFAAALAIANYSHSKVISVAILLCPLILTRAVIFINKLPLMALYPVTDQPQLQKQGVYAHTEF